MIERRFNYIEDRLVAFIEGMQMTTKRGLPVGQSKSFRQYGISNALAKLSRAE